MNKKGSFERDRQNTYNIMMMAETDASLTMAEGMVGYGAGEA